MKYRKTLFWENKENTIKESKKYSSRTEFMKKSHGAYVSAKRNGWLDEMAWLNRKNVYKDPIDTVYRYYFEKENAVYVGRTIYPELRDKQHRERKNDSVNKFAKEHDIEIPKMEILENKLTIVNGAQREAFWEKFYRDNDFIIINKQPCGSLGLMAKGKWSKEKCIEESKKYKTRSQFQRNASQAFHKSMENGWIDEMTWLPSPKSYPKGYWKNKENFFKEAKKYNSKKELEEGNLAAYHAGWRYGYLNEVDWKTERKTLPFGYWKKKENCIEEAKKYKTKKEFQKNNQSAYWASLKYGYLDEMSWLVKNKVSKKGSLQNKEQILEESKKYKTRTEFMKANKSMYDAAQRYGYLKEMVWLPEQKPNGFWNIKENVIKESKKYSSRSQFKKGSYGAYRAAHKYGYINELTWLSNGK